MGPLFSILLALTVAGVIATGLFLVAIFFIPWRLAMRMALAGTIGGAIGFVGTLFAQIPFYPEKLTLTAMVVSYLGLAALGGLFGAVLCATMLWKISRRTK